MNGHLWVFVISNVFILLGYTFVALRVLPLFPVTRWTKAAAVSFFLLCGIGTHGEMLSHTLSDRNEHWGHLAMEHHMIAIHILQAVSVWVFATGFFRDFKRLERERQTTSPATERGVDAPVT